MNPETRQALNSKLEALRLHLIARKEDLKGLQTNFGELKSRRDALQVEIGDINNKITKIQEDINA